MLPLPRQYKKEISNKVIDVQLGAVVAVDGAFGPKGSPGELNE